MNVRRVAASVAAMLILAPSTWAHKPTVTTFTFHDDIYPIFESKCGACHRSGGVAPMSLLDYAEAFPWAVSIKNEILSLAMPPWYADERFGAFKHGGALSAKEMDTIVDWCLGGSPEGESGGSRSGGSDAAWTLGRPDLELVMPAVFELDADTSEAIAEIELATELDSERFLRAVDFRPGSANIVRSAMLILDDGSEPLTTWIPGQAPEELPSGVGWEIPAGATIHLRVHYKKTWLDEGTAVSDRSALALYFHRSAASRRIETLAVDAGSPLTMASSVLLFALLPALESDIDAMSAELVRPDGSRQELLRLHQPRADWPRKYWLAEPLALPSGSRVEVSVASSEPVTPSLILDIVTP